MRLFPLGRRLTCSQGFTLAELLIALAILGIIAIFSIPKILQAQQDQRFNTIAKEDASAVAAAYQQYLQDNVITAGTSATILSPFFNYIRIDTVGIIDDYYGRNNPANCAAIDPCLRMANGSTIRLLDWSFGGTASTNAIGFQVDPDSINSNTTNGTGKSIEFWMYTTGRLTTNTALSPTSCNSNGCYNSFGGVPPWFSWN